MTHREGTASWLRLIATIGALALLDLSSASADDDDWVKSEHLGGTFTVYSFGETAYTRAAPGLELEDRQRFSDGSVAFRQTTSDDAPSGRDRNAASCDTCHLANGRGIVRAESFATTGFSAPTEMGGSRTPIFRTPVTEGPAVARLDGISWRVKRTVTLRDGTKVELVVPVAIVDGQSRHVDLRNAPGVYGLGLLEAVPESAIRELARSRPHARLGILGVAAGSETAGRLGRFGWKARFSSLDAQVESAMVVETGMAEAGAASSSFAISKKALTSYVRLLAVPARQEPSQAEYVRGAKIFARIGCATCHQPTWRTGNTDDVPAEARDQVIHPFTDLLLHDMGDELRDPNDSELSRLWRTPALWGIGMQSAVSDDVGFLHDGRARTLLEAILWHGGEAAGVTKRFAGLPTKDRKDLLAFLSSL